MEIATTKKGYILIFYNNPAVTFDSDKDTVELEILTRKDLVNIRDKINEIVAKEDDRSGMVEG